MKKFETTTKNYDVKIPPTEMDGRTQLLGSCTTVNCTVQYFLRCFIKVKSIFEIG